MAAFSPTVVRQPRSQDLVDYPLEIRSAGIGFEGREILDLLHEAGAATVERRYTRGEVMFGEGDAGDALYVLTEGAVKLSGGYHGGKEVTLMLLGPWGPVSVTLVTTGFLLLASVRRRRGRQARP